MSDVDFHEGLRVLGVTLQADPKVVRRAYLRQLKKTSPERDPEGFMRLRAAYEVVREEQPWRQLVETDEEEPAPAPGPGSPESSRTELDEAPSGGGPLIIEMPVDATDANDVDLSSYYNRLDDLDARLTHDEDLTRKAATEQRLGIAREALDSHPESAGAHRLLASVLFREQQAATTRSDRGKQLRKELATVLRLGRQVCRCRTKPEDPGPSHAGDDFLFQLIYCCPSILNDSELQEALHHPDPRLQLIGAEALVANRRCDEAEAVAQRWLGELQSQFESDPAVYSGLKDLVSRLMGRGELLRGVNLGLQLLQLVWNKGDELRVVSMDSNWVLLDELINLVEGELAVEAERSRASRVARLAAPQDYQRLLPRRFLTAIADAIRDNDPESEAWQPLQLTVDQDLEEAAELTGRLERTAPNLAELIGLALAISYGVAQPKTAADHRAEREQDDRWDEQIRTNLERKNRSALWTLGLLTGTLMILIAGVITAWYFRDKKRRSGNPHQPMEELSVSSYLHPRDPRVETAIAIADGVCTWSRHLYNPTKQQLCDHAFALAHAMRVADCDTVKSIRTALTMALDRHGRWHRDLKLIGFPESRAVFDRRLGRGVDELCSSQPGVRQKQEPR